MDFSKALTHLKAGARLSRSGWNGKGMFIFLVKGSRFSVSRPPLNEIFPEGKQVDYRPHIDMRYADGTIGIWVASHSDLLEDDWFIV